MWFYLLQPTNKLNRLSWLCKHTIELWSLKTAWVPHLCDFYCPFYCPPGKNSNPNIYETNSTSLHQQAKRFIIHVHNTNSIGQVNTRLILRVCSKIEIIIEPDHVKVETSSLPSFLRTAINILLKRSSYFQPLPVDHWQAACISHLWP